MQSGFHVRYHIPIWKNRWRLSGWWLPAYVSRLCSDVTGVARVNVRHRDPYCPGGVGSVDWVLFSKYSKVYGVRSSSGIIPRLPTKLMNGLSGFWYYFQGWN